MHQTDPVTGTSVYASSDIPALESVALCPNRLAITPALCRSKLERLPVELGSWTDHELMAVYLAFHVVERDMEAASDPAVALDHAAYVNLLPKEALMTPINFSDNELALLKGTNLYAATIERRDKWHHEWDVIRSRHAALNAIKWPQYLWACTMISSRAFPSRLVDGDDSDPTPILLPGVDMLNHDLSAKVTWSTSEYSDNGKVALVIESASPAGFQIFNNYGPKPNEEFMLGYGFLPRRDQRVGDVVALRTAIPPRAAELVRPILTKLGLTETLFFINREGVLPEELQTQMRVILAVQAFNEQELEIPSWTAAPTFVSWETELDMFSMFQAMLANKLTSVMTEPERAQVEVRQEVEAMCDEYRHGQKEILMRALELLESTFEELLDKARGEGFDISEYIEEGDEDDDEDDQR
ncbi:hypothetical protein OIV83_002524 [Microbotryomycetes sp. JL201]|nr:hypothetical protein OIV83_002524 [Microbotryomycetes sp. JL201]